MFENKNKPSDLIKHVQEQRKLVPYTIREIGGVEEYKVWKRLLAEQEETHQQRKAARHSKVINKLQTAMDNSGAYEDVVTKKSQTTRAFEPRVFKTLPPVAITPKTSIFTKLFNYLTNLFLSVNYEPKD